MHPTSAHGRIATLGRQSFFGRAVDDPKATFVTVRFLEGRYQRLNSVTRIFTFADVDAKLVMLPLASHLHLTGRRVEQVFIPSLG